MNPGRVPLWSGVAIAIAVVAGTGCTTYLDARRVIKDEPSPTQGAPYYLSFTQYTINMSRRLIACTDTQVAVAVLATIVPAEQPDPQNIYVINFDELQSALKSTSVTVQYHPNGRLKSVNALAEDRTGPVIVGAATLVGKVVLAASGVPGVVKTVGVEDVPQPLCNRRTIESLTVLKDSKSKIEAKTATVARLAADLTNLTSQAAAMGEAWDLEARKRWSEKQAKLYKEQTALDEIRKKVASALAHLSIVADPIVWPDDGEVFASATSFHDVEVKDTDKWWQPGTPYDKVAATLPVTTRVWLALESQSPIARKEVCRADSKQDSARCAAASAPGLKYRVPAAGVLKLCRWASCDWETHCVKPGEQACDASVALNPAGKEACRRTVRIECEKRGAPHATHPGMVSQLGPIMVLPLRSAAFTKKTVKASFDELGRPTELGVESGAAAEAAMAAAADVTDQALKVRDALVTTRLERLKAQTELLTAEKALDDAKKALEPPPPAPEVPPEVPPSEQEKARAALEAETGLLNAELANLQARRALDEARRVAVGQ